MEPSGRCYRCRSESPARRSLNSASPQNSTRPAKLLQRICSRQPNLKSGLPRNGFELNVPTMFFYDPLDRVEPQPRTFSHALGCEKRLEDMRSYVVRDSRAVIGDFYHHPIVLTVGPHF